MLSATETEIGGQLVGCTIVRLLGFVRLVPRTDGTRATPVPTEASFGVQVGPDTLDTDDLRPDSNPEQDWMHYGFLRDQNGVDGYDPMSWMRFDIRSRRRVDEVAEILWFCAENGGTNTVTVEWFYRILVMLP